MAGQSPIPIQNIFYLLAYAWDYFREEDQQDFANVDCPDSLNLLAHLLATGVSELTTRGIDRNYELQTEATPRLRGRFDLLGSYRRGLHFSGRLRCEFDELTVNTLPNQILRTTCERLIRAKRQLRRDIRASVRGANDLLQDVSVTPLTPGIFNRVQLHRNNRHYRLLLSICELLHDCFLPSQQQGDARFSDIFENETRMHQVFEKFVLRFAKRHCKRATVQAMKIEWDRIAGPEVNEVLPNMYTDVTIKTKTSATILDCKYYKEALVTRYDKERLHSSHLYQLTAYLKNKERDAGWERARGVLLYPAVNHRQDLLFELLGHPVEIRSIDLDQPWREIHERLLEILNA